MTRPGKCEACRRRKLKCDEIHPICSPCIKSLQECRYSGPGSKYRPRFASPNICNNAPKANLPAVSDGEAQNTNAAETTVRVEMDFSVRSMRKARSGRGLYQTWVPTLPVKKPKSDSWKGRAAKAYCNSRDESPSLIIEPSDSSMALCRRWISFTETISTGFDTHCILGDWMELVAQRIGMDNAVDSALKCFLYGSITYVNRTDENLALTDKYNLRALQCIRATILSSTSKQLHENENVLISIVLLHFVEYFVRAASGEYLFHQTGLPQMLHRVSKKGTKCSEVMRRIFFHCAPWDTAEAVAEGRDSLFDEPQWHALRSTGYQSLDQSMAPLNFVQDYNTMHRIKWPRLIRLMRQAQIFGGDEAARTEAVELAAELYVHDLEPWAQSLLDQDLIKIVPTISAAYQLSIPLSYDFVSFLVHGCYIDYLVSRSIICGLVLTLSSIGPTIPSMHQFDISAVISEDIRMAEQILMCTQYSMTAYTAIPIAALRQIMPLKTSYAAWKRHESRASGYIEDSEEMARAQQMKQLCLQMAEDLGGQWGISRFNSDSWERAFGGQPSRR